MITRYKNKSNKRKARIVAKISKTSLEYRLVVRRSNKYLYAQMLKLATGKTLFGIRSTDPQVLGKQIAAKALEMKISSVVFDRGSYKYHGNIKIVADAAREAGLKF